MGSDSRESKEDIASQVVTAQMGIPYLAIELCLDLQNAHTYKRMSRLRIKTVANNDSIIVGKHQGPPWSVSADFLAVERGEGFERSQKRPLKASVPSTEHFHQRQRHKKSVSMR